MLDENDTTTPGTDRTADLLTPSDPLDQASPPPAAAEDDMDPTAQTKKAPRRATRKVGARAAKKSVAAETAPGAGAAPSEDAASPDSPGPDAPGDAPSEAPGDAASEAPTGAQVAEEGAALSAEQVSGVEETADPTAPGDAVTRRSTAKKATEKRTTKKATAKKATAKKTAVKRTAKTSVSTDTDLPDGTLDLDDAGAGAGLPDPRALAGAEAEAGEDTPGQDTSGQDTSGQDTPEQDTPEQDTPGGGTGAPTGQPVAATSLLFQVPDPVAATPRRRRRTAGAPVDEPSAETPSGGSPSTSGAPDAIAATRNDATPEAPDTATSDTRRSAETVGSLEPAGDAPGEDTDDTDDAAESDDEQGGNRRRRRRGGRRRRRGGSADGAADGGADGDGGEDTDDDAEETGTDRAAQAADDQDAAPAGRGQRRAGQRSRKDPATQADQDESGQKDQKDQKGSGQKDSGQRSADRGEEESGDEGAGTRRRRRRRRTGDDADASTDEPNTVVRVRKPRNAEDEITSLHGSTRLEAKKQRRREGREAGRRRAPIVSEAEFLARREAVDRVMVIRQRNDLTQIAVLEDKVLVEHYVARESQTSLIGNVYLGRVQNVLPSMEAAFIDIGKGRNAVLYAGEVNWDSLGAGNGPRKIEQVLKSGQPILVQVSKDPIGHKGARLTSQISLPGRFLVYVPDGTTSGISRKLPDTERTRLKTLLKEIVPDTAGVIVRTAAEGASEEELTLDVERLTARWADIESRVEKGNAPQLLYGEPDLTLKVVRDLFTEDFAKLVVSGDEAWDMVDGYVKHVAPDLEDRLERYAGEEDVFAAYRIDEQIAKGLDRKVWLPSGGSLVIDRTEAMTVVDVNTGKFTGSGGNLEETVTKNNLEAAEEIVRQLRLRDIGGIIVVDFIDMVLESNRDLVLRRLVECLGRDRTRHQVAEVTSLGLVQMTRKRIGTGLLEAFSETCDHCQGRGVVIHHEPVELRRQQDEEPRRGRRGRGRDGDEVAGRAGVPVVKASPSPKDIAAMAKHEPRPVDHPPAETVLVDPPSAGPALAGDVAPGDVGSAGAGSADLVQADGAGADGGAPGERDAAGAPVGDGAVSAPEGVTADREAETGSPAPAPGDQAPPRVDEGRHADTSGAPVDGTGPSQAGADRSGAPQVPAGPRLVTSTRRRVARRPAGPPVSAMAGHDGHSSAEADGAAPAMAGVAPDHRHAGVEDADGTPSEAFGGEASPGEQAHVPVKRRGRGH